MPYLSAQKTMLAKWKLKLGWPPLGHLLTHLRRLLAARRTGNPMLGASNRRIHYPTGLATTGSDWNWFQPARGSKEKAR
jgi:hypothetical protein